MSRRYFSPDLFAFLGDLADNNNRAWFNEHKARYEASVRQPALDFITDFVELLEALSPYFVADSRTVGGSLFRIHRDTRFAKDKTPYKLNTGMHFRHERAKDAHSPGFYVHLQPRSCFIGLGLWMPEPKVAYQIRGHIDENQDEWIAATQSKVFTSMYELGGDSLKRPPRGFDVEHPLLEDMKRKSFIATGPIKHSDVTKASFREDLAERFMAGAPLMKFLCAAVGVKY
ncbi:MAG: TIGR02453 family protein [Actinobacteria bacterium]|nr:TIGR02453 family protein [Actinomycetota bacterium]